MKHNVASISEITAACCCCCCCFNVYHLYSVGKDPMFAAMPMCGL